MSSVSKTTRKPESAQKRDTADTIVYSIDEIRKLLNVGRATAYDVARKIGRRVGKRRGRLVVSRRALETWLHGEVTR